MANLPRRIALAARRWFDAALVHLLPARCFACGATLPAVQLLGACATCWTALAPIPAGSCRRCALPMPAVDIGHGAAGGRCLRCEIRPLPVEEAVAAVRYDATARRFLLRAKDQGRIELLAPLGAQVLARVVDRGLASRADVVVAVPSSRRARLRRGFDPASVLARVVARGCGLPILEHALQRRGFSGIASKRLHAAERWRAAQRLVVATRGLPDLRVLLVDDVLTTGATLSACATALRNSGAHEVRAAVWARTPPPRGDF